MRGFGNKLAGVVLYYEPCNKNNMPNGVFFPLEFEQYAVCSAYYFIRDPVNVPIETQILNKIFIQRADSSNF